MRNADTIVACLIGCASAVTSVRTLASNTAAANDVSPVQLDINTADWPELLNVAGVGETLGRRIVENRNQFGPFSSVAELSRVEGIGAKSIETMEPFLTTN